jgi:hypothetical protein
MTERDELISDFTASEVETTRSLLECLHGPTTTDSFRRLLLLFLRGHYSSPRNYMGFDHLSCYVWSPSSADSTLTVEFTHKEDDQNPDNYPGVYVGFSQTDFNKVVVGNYAGGTQDRAGRHMTKEAVVNFSISHVAQKASDAYDLAELTAMALTAMAAPLASNAGALEFEVQGMSLPKRKKPSPDNYYTVAVAVQITYSMSVTRSIESHRIRRIALLLQSTTSES